MGKIESPDCPDYEKEDTEFPLLDDIFSNFVIISKYKILLDNSKKFTDDEKTSISSRD